MTNRSESFGRLLKAGIGSIASCEGKTAPVIEEELGRAIGVAAHTIQRYKAGHLPPEARTVEILAEACVRRGLMSREWLQKLLVASYYPAIDSLLDKLRPLGSLRPRLPRVYENLPAPTYGQFVMRQQAFAEVVEGLQQRTAVVVIIGMGGNGKTSLAREIATYTLRGAEPTLRFDAVIWVSDKDRPGTTNLSVVLDEMARTLDYPGFTQFAFDEKRREVEQLLRRQRVLVIIDNFETITDHALLDWLLKVPEPSKVLITAREYRREFRRGGWLVELWGMTESEAFAFIQERLKVLRFTALIGDPRVFDPLVAVTGGNPKAIEMALGLVKHQRQPLQQVLDDLGAARGELFADLFTHAWSLLDTTAQRILLAMPLFASSSGEAAMSALTQVRGFAFSAAVERLTDLALLDVRHPMDLQSEARYVLHPLVRAFVTTKLHATPHLESELREKWVEWYAHLVEQVGYCWNDQGRLKLLDPEHETIQTVIEWSIAQKRWSEALKIVKGIGYYYYIRGMWEQNPPMYLGGFETTYTQADAVEETEALAYHIQMLCKQGKPDLAERYVPRLQELVRTVELPEVAFFELQHAIALFAIAQQDLDQAEAVWQQTLELAQKLDVRAYIANRRWLATCLYRKGLDQEAEQLLSEALRDAVEHHYVHGIVSIQTKLAHIYLDRNDTDRASAVLHDGHHFALHAQEHRHVAAFQQCTARLHAMRGDLTAAREALGEAVDLFERLGMRRDLEAARAELTRLESGSASSPLG